MKKWFVLCISAVVFCSAILFLPTEKDAQIYQKTLRLHVLANSDSKGDQQRKLAVRDTVLSLLTEEMQNCSSREQASEVILKNEEKILSACRQTLLENGSLEEVKLSLCEEYYPTRIYEDIALPSGEYLSLQIQIGQAKGKNWWCVLYPPVCLSGASSDKTLLQVGFQKDQIQLVSENRNVRYAVKFKILETVGSFFYKLFS